MFARRTNWTLEENALSLRLGELKAAGIEIIDLTESNPTRCGFTVPAEELLAPLSGRRNLVYAPSAKGLKRAREAVCRFYDRKGVPLSPEQVFLTASTSEAYSFLFRLLADPGDSVLFPCPGYPLFEFLSGLNDCIALKYRLKYDGRWQIGLDDFEARLASGVRAALFVHPNNPTGSYVSRSEQEAVSRLCRTARVPLICDEVFHDYGFADDVPPSFAGRQDGLTFTLGGLSKWLGLPQMKLSWIVVNGPPSEQESAVRRLEVIADTYLSVNTPVQHAFVDWSAFQEKWHQPIRTRVRTNYQRLAAMVAACPRAALLAAEGGWYGMIGLPEGVSEESFCLDLLTRDQTCVHPGYFYDLDDGPAIAVVSLLPEPRVFEQGMARLLEGVNRQK